MATSNRNSEKSGTGANSSESDDDFFANYHQPRLPTNLNMVTPIQSMEEKGELCPNCIDDNKFKSKSRTNLRATEPNFVCCKMNNKLG